MSNTPVHFNDYLKNLTENKNYLNHDMVLDLFHGPWELREDDKELRIELKQQKPVTVAVNLGILILLILLFASWIARFAYKDGSFWFIYLFYSIAFMTSAGLVVGVFFTRRNLVKKGRCWFVWNKWQNTVSLPRKNLSFSSADILALQYREPGGEDTGCFEVVVFTRENLHRIYVLGFYGAPSDERIVHDTARFLKKPLIRIPYSGKEAPVVWKEHCQENEL